MRKMKGKARLFWTVGVLGALLLAALGCDGVSGPIAPPTAADSAEGPIVPKKRIPLHNGQDFAGWKLFVPNPDVDVHGVWSVSAGVIRCTGTPAGYMRTEADFANYKLRVEWRWPEGGGNSGVLLHVSEPDQVWPKSIEAQLMSGNAGDFYAIGGTDFSERVDKSSTRVAKKAESSEKPLGEWNADEILCRDDTIRVFVNGVLQNEATETTARSGKIGLQSEGKPIEFRNVHLEPLD
jgi:hypothetical protein